MHTQSLSVTCFVTLGFSSLTRLWKGGGKEAKHRPRGSSPARGSVWPVQWLWMFLTCSMANVQTTLKRMEIFPVFRLSEKVIFFRKSLQSWENCRIFAIATSQNPGVFDYLHKLTNMKLKHFNFLVESSKFFLTRIKMEKGPMCVER